MMMLAKDRLAVQDYRRIVTAVMMLTKERLAERLPRKAFRWTASCDGGQPYCPISPASAGRLQVLQDLELRLRRGRYSEVPVPACRRYRDRSWSPRHGRCGCRLIWYHCEYRLVTSSHTRTTRLFIARGLLRCFKDSWTTGVRWTAFCDSTASRRDNAVPCREDYTAVPRFDLTVPIALYSS